MGVDRGSEIDAPQLCGINSAASRSRKQLIEPVAEEQYANDREHDPASSGRQAGWRLTSAANPSHIDHKETEEKRGPRGIEKRKEIVQSSSSFHATTGSPTALQSSYPGYRRFSSAKIAQVCRPDAWSWSAHALLPDERPMQASGVHTPYYCFA